LYTASSFIGSANALEIEDASISIPQMAIAWKTFTIFLLRKLMSDLASLKAPPRSAGSGSQIVCSLTAGLQLASSSAGKIQAPGKPP
jgi:hypothetical protein